MRRRVARVSGKFKSGESGMAFIETLVALALLGIISVTFLSGMATTSKATGIADEQTTAESLARSQMEWAKKVAYVYEATGYSPAPIPGSEDYINYSANITAEPLNDPDEGIQKITVTIKRSNLPHFQVVLRMRTTMALRSFLVSPVSLPVNAFSLASFFIFHVFRLCRPGSLLKAWLRLK